MRRLSAVIFGFYAAYATWFLLVCAALCLIPRDSRSYIASCAAIIVDTILALVVGVLAGRRAYSDLGNDRTAHCRNCGYLLVKLSEPRCPECATPFDPYDLPAF